MYAQLPRLASTLGKARRRGSVLILVVVILVLVMLIGTAFIQSARRDRFASGQMNNNNIEEIARSALDQVLTLIDTDGRNGTNVLGGGATGEDEPYDYPDLRIDPYLCQTYPLNLGGQVWWYQIARTDESQMPNTLLMQTGKLIADMADPGKMTLPGDARSADADADGDGLTDSDWVRAPIASLRGVDYFYCARIIDASSMLDVNTATSLSSTGGYDADTDSPRCWFPSELDLGNFVLSFTNQDASADTELTQLLKFRFGLDNDPANTRVPWFQAQNLNDPYQRFIWWTMAGQMYGNLNHNTGLSGTSTSYSQLGLGDEFELRMRNGLNSPDTKSLIDTLMPQLMRDGVVNGARRDKSDGTIVDFLADGGWGSGQQAEYFQLNPRTMLTTFSGANDLGGRWGGAGAAVEPRRDINRLAENPADLAAELSTLFSQGSFQVPAGLKNLSITDFANRYAACIVDYLDRDATNVTLPDNLLTDVNGQYGFEPLPMLTEVYVQQHYTITQAQQVGGAGPPAPGAKQDWTVTWEADGQGVGYAIEIRNPYGYAVSLKHVFLYVDGTKFGELSSLAGGNPWLLPYQALVLYRKSGGAHDLATLIPAADPSPDFPEAGTAVRRKAISNLWPTGSENPFNGGDKDAEKVTVELRASTGKPGGAAAELGFAYSKADSKKLPTKQSNLTYTTADANTDPKGTDGFLQYDRAGDARGLNCLTVPAADFNARYNTKGLPTEAAGGDGYESNLQALGKFDKSDIGKAGEFAGAWNRHQFTCAGPEQGGQMRWIGELLQVPLIALSATDQKTFPQIWKDDAGNGGAKSHVDFLIDLNAKNNIGTGNQAVPHFVAMLDRFTTLAPDEDGQDNDGDGGADGADPEKGEYFIPGKININTVAGDITGKYPSVDNGTHLLMRCLPIPDMEVRKQVVKAILKYRDDPISQSAKIRKDLPSNPRPNLPGIAYIGELMLIPDVRDALGHPDTTSGDSGGVAEGNVLSPDDTFKLNGVTVDRTTADPQQATSPFTYKQDHISDDREEQVMLFKWLSQMLTTRTDRYVVYITVRGYLSSKGSGGGALAANYPSDAMVEQRSYIALVDRSTQTDNNGTGAVRLLGLYKY